MMADDFSVVFDSGSLSTITNMVGFSALLDPNLQGALTQAGQIIVTTAQANTWEVFDNPTGELADSIYFYVTSPTELDLSVGVIYGRRRELGGGGLTDSLGRPMNDRARPYLDPAVETDAPLIQELIATAIYNTWGAL